MSTWKLASKLPKSLLDGKTADRHACNSRLFVSASRPLQEKAQKEKEEAFKHVQEAADAWKDTAVTVKQAAQNVSKGAKAVTKSVTEATNAITEKAKETVKESLGKKAKEIFEDKFFHK